MTSQAARITATSLAGSGCATLNRSGPTRPETSRLAGAMRFGGANSVAAQADRDLSGR